MKFCISKFHFLAIVIKQDFRKNPETYFISYNTKNNFIIPKKLFYSYKLIYIYGFQEKIFKI